MSRVLVCSMPKAGTYLMAKILEGLGYRDTGWHLQFSRYQDYGKTTLEEGRSSPQSVTKNVGFSEMIGRIPNGHFAVCHLSPKVVLPVLGENPEFRVLFLTRNILDIFVSFNHWYRSSGRWKPRFESLFGTTKPKQLRLFFRVHKSEFERIRSAAEWASASACFTISFESMTGQWGRQDQVRKISELAVFLDKTLPSSVADLIDGALGSDSLTKSNRDRSDRDAFYDMKNLKILEKQGMLKLNAQLGYSNLDLES